MTSTAVLPTTPNERTERQHRVAFDVWNEVPIVPQLTGMSCWAAAAAMLVGWRERARLGADDLARAIDRMRAYQDGLEPEDVDTLARQFELTVVPDQEWSVPWLASLLTRFGPLWMGEASPGLHAIVLTGAYGDGTPEGSFVRINDPWPIGRGERYVLPFKQLVENFRAATDSVGTHSQLLHSGGRRGPSRHAYFEEHKETRTVSAPRSEDSMYTNGHSSTSRFGRARAHAFSLVSAGERYLSSALFAQDPLASHGGSGENLFLRWNDLPADVTEVDVVVHLHGYDSGGPTRATLERRVALSGADVSRRSRPTLVVIPRGRKVSQQELDAERAKGREPNTGRYTFEGLTARPGMAVLIDQSLNAFARDVLGRSDGTRPACARLILTAHSGGGAALNQVLRGFDAEGGANPSEVHVFDGIYGGPGRQGDGIVRWATARITADAVASPPGAVRGDMAQRGGSLRILFGPGTRRGSEWIRDNLAGAPLLGGTAAALAPFYRVDDAGADHNGIPVKNGPVLLSDASAPVVLSAGAYGTPLALFSHYAPAAAKWGPGRRSAAFSEEEESEDVGAETGEGIATGQSYRVSRSLAATWANDDVSIDYRHLLPAAGVSQIFTFSGAHLDALARANRFPVPETGKVVFGLRGCTIASGNDGAFHSDVQLSEDMPDHQATHCVIGVWDRDSGNIAVFTGSTVPNEHHMQRMVDGKSNSNMLLTGFHRFKVGTHRKHYRGMLRESGDRAIIRSRNDLIYTTSDDFEVFQPGDNIHPSFRAGSMAFSSAGCLTVRGTATKDDASANPDLHSDPNDGTPGWATFRERLGLTRDSAPASEDGRSFSLVLLTGREARLVSTAGTATALQRLRQGSEGPDVSTLQTFLAGQGLFTGTVDGQMGPATTMAWVRFQQRRDGGTADGIVTPNDGATVGVTLGGAGLTSGQAYAGARARLGQPTPAFARAARGFRLGRYGRVDPEKVSCESYPRSYPIFKSMGTEDPVGEIEAAAALAVQFMDSTVSELERIRDRIIAGEKPNWPLMSDLLAWSLKTRMLIDPNDTAVWTGTGPGTVEFVIRWIKNIRKIVDGGELHYTCLGTQCDATTFAYVLGNTYRIHLCGDFWSPPNTANAREVLEERALTIIHEASHIYYSTEDSGKGQGAAECINQFIADANGVTIRNLKGRCGAVDPPMPAPAP